jgi:sec-independent protein translocase protein TatA
MPSRVGPSVATLAKAAKPDYLVRMLIAVVGTMEIVIIVAVILLIFGPSKLPQLGEGIGKMLRGFKKEMKAIEDDKKVATAGTAPAAADERDEIDVTPKGEGDAKPKPKSA